MTFGNWSLNQKKFFSQPDDLIFCSRFKFDRHYIITMANKILVWFMQTFRIELEQEQKL